MSSKLLLIVIGLAYISRIYAQPRAIDTAKSVLTVHVSKSGPLSAFGHNHTITAPIAGGSADSKAHKVELRVNARALRVADQKASEKDRGEIEKTMLGPEVLDAERHREITFQSISVEPAGTGTWRVQGNLTLHGETRPVEVEVREKDAHFVGSSRFKQTDFGMKPVKIAGGTVRVKDEVRIEFDIQLARAE
jgi:polyisoprenoid-binding protein YceI